MAVAYFLFHAPRGFFPAVNGGDAAILFCFVFLYLVTVLPARRDCSRRETSWLVLHLGAR